MIFQLWNWWTLHH